VFYFGGYMIPLIDPQVVVNFFASQGFSSTGASLMSGLVHHIVLLIKILFFLWVFIWVRWTLPRFRYDQLMDLGWKTMLPVALANTIITAIVIYIAKMG